VARVRDWFRPHRTGRLVLTFRAGLHCFRRFAFGNQCLKICTIMDSACTQGIRSSALNDSGWRAHSGRRRVASGLAEFSAQNRGKWESSQIMPSLGCAGGRRRSTIGHHDLSSDAPENSYMFVTGPDVIKTVPTRSHQAGKWSAMTTMKKVGVAAFRLAR